MNGFMPVETFGDQALHRTPHRSLIAKRDLILRHNMEGSMDHCVREANACAPMVVTNDLNLLLLINRTPSFEIGRFEGTLTLH